MKKIYLLLFSIFALLSNASYAQSGDNCANAAPFCTGTSYNFPNNTGIASLGGGGAYGCLGSTPNPVWYFMQIATPGNLDITINQGPTPGSTGQDVDFVCWGPFPNQASMCAGYNAGNIVDCSYSTASTEVCNITGAATGQFYLMLLTNFSNSAGYISFTNTGGAATTNCAILCNITALTANPGACNPATNQYSVTGQVTVTAPPSTGTLTLSSSCGGSVVMSPPFTSPINYTIPGITANGAGCTVTAAFSADATCTFTRTYTSPAPCNACTATANNGGPYCAGATIGLSATGGGTYSWSGPSGFTSTAANPTRPGATAAMAGTYTVTVTNGAATCTATTTVVVNPIPTANAGADIAYCSGASGTIGAAGVGGTTYSWSPTTGLSSGTAANPTVTVTNGTAAPVTTSYTVTATAAGCTATDVVNVTVNPVPTATYTQSANQCLTGNSFTFTNTGVNGASHNWTFTGGTPGTSTATSPAGVTWPAAGTYNVSHVVTATGGCTATINSTVTIYPMPTGLNATTGPATCGAANGTITITGGVGGTAPYTYSVNGGAFSGTLGYTGQTAGSHTIIVRDANGCTFTTTVNVPTSSGPTALATTTVNSTCGAANGIVNIGATTGGTAAYTYSINGSAFTGTVSYTGLAAGTYTVVVRDANGCTFTVNPVVANTPGPTALATTTVNSTCGATNGTVNIGAVTGGTAAYQYSINGSAFTGTTSYTGLAAGTYTVVVRDANGCTFTVNPVVANSPGPTAIVRNTTNSTCGNSNGTITLGAVTGGTAAYTYSVAGSAFTATTNYTGFAAGVYTVVVSDANGCTFSTTATVANSAGPTALASTPTNSSCGASNGSIALGAVTGGVPAYTYSFNGSAFTGTTNYTGLAAGTYTVVVRDANGCTFTINPIVNNASGPTALVVNSTNANCGASNGTVTIGAVTGGLAPFTYSFNGSGYTGTTNYTGVAAGTYNVSVRDANNCTFNTTVTVNNVPGPTALVSNTTNSTCGASNGVVTLGAVTGGTAAYVYSINGSAFTATTNYTGLAAGTFTVVVRDVNGCTFTINPVVANTPGPTAQATTTTNSTCGNANGTITIGATTGGTSPYVYSVNASAFTSTVNYTGLAAGTYTVVVRDANNCTFTVNPIVVNTPGPTAQATTTVNATCGNSNGVVNIGATTGGTAPYTFAFDGGGSTATTSYTGLAAGTHTVVVTDANGCTFTVNPVVGNTPGPTAIVRNTTSSTCGGTNGAITLGAVTGGTAPYTYSVNGSPFTATTNYTGLAANTYAVIVQDANGCQFTTSATITDLSGLVANITAQTNVSCNGGTNGSVTVTASGSTAPYSYSFNAGAFVASGTFTGLAAGSYTVTAKDGNGCTLTVPVTITQPSLLTGVIATQTNINCFGGTTGAVTVTGGGGTTAYSYSIDGGAFGASATFTGLNAGVHTVVIRDANLCTVNVPVTITQPTALTLATSSVNAICTAANGSATVVASGATPTYTYLWAPGGQTTATSSNVTAGNYSVLVTDFNGCTQTANVSVGSSPGGTATMSSSSNVTCNGSNDGTATVSMGGASTPPFVYAWSNSQTTVTATGLSAAGYTVTVTDANGCISSATAVITEPAVITHAFANTNVSCFGGNNGSSTITPAGGTAPYTYFWTGIGQTTPTATGLSAGTYTVTVTDANGCTHTGSTTITAPTGMALSETHVDANCSQSNGSATVTVAGGTGPYTYSWSTLPVQTTATATGLAANTYGIQVTDANGCIQSLPVTVSNLAGPSASIFSSNNVSCNGGTNGSATAVISGGTGPFTYAWSPSGGSLPTATNLAAGGYVMNATDANGCVASTSVTITEPLVLATSFVPTNPSCAAVCDASVTTTTMGGTAPYSYLWSPGGMTTQNVTGLCAGSYTLQVTDANGCIVFKYVTLTDPVAITASATSSNVSCSGMCNASVTANALTGTGPFTYLWSDINAQTTQTATSLCAGSFTVTVTDANGCSTTAISNITSPISLTANITASGNVSCFGACDGFATVAVTGGSAPYSYMWMPSGTAGASVNNLCAANYTVTCTDANGCSATATVTITEPNALTASITNTNVTCYNACDAQATAVYNGGTGPYTFLWTPALQTTPTATSLCAGVQNLQVTDANGCIANASVVITEPTILAVTTTTTNSNCGSADGSACAAITGGVPPFIYSWNDPGTQATSCASNLNAGVYTISITDANGCSVTNVANVNDNTAPIVTIPTSTNVTCGGAANGSAQGNITGGILPYAIMWTPSSQTTLFANGLSGGIYSMIVTDSVGCVGSASITITEPSTLISGIIATANTSCNLACDGSATVLAGGGTAPFTYLWNDVAVQTTAMATNLCAANYTVTVTDANGCTSTSVATINEPTQLVTNLVSQTNILCNGGNNGQITVVDTGGTPGYTYAWTPGVGSSTTVTNLVAGNYQLVVTDANGCAVTTNYTITEPTVMVLTPNSNPSTCGSANGSAGVSVTGGTTPFNYFWTPTGLTTAIIPNVPAGTYNVTVTDANGCIDTINSTVLNIAGPTISSVTSTMPSCNGLSNGTATVVATGGQPLYSYQWTGPGTQTTQTANALPAGLYSVTVTDQNNCTVTGSIVVNQPDTLTVIASPTDTICIGQLSQIYAAGFGGTGPYSYVWNPASLGATGGPFVVTPTTPTSYTVAATDANGCVSANVVTTVFVNPQIAVVATDVSVCDGGSVFISATASGGNGGPYNYTWSNGATGSGQLVSPPVGSSPANYTVTADDGGCSISITDVSTVTVNPLAVIFMTTPDTAGCEPFNAQFNGLSDIGVSYTWNYGDGIGTGTGPNTSYVYTGQGSYDVTLTVTTALGCVSSITTTGFIDVYPSPNAGFTSSPNPATSTAPVVTFTDISIGATEWDWDFIYTIPQSGLFTDTLQNTFFSYPDSGSYTVQQVVTNSFGCTDTAYDVIEVIPEYVLYTPNAFTPFNHDGLNDTFMPTGVGIDPANFEMYIFDRWGNLIYKTTDVTKPWDGTANGGKTIAQIDTYVWKVKTKDFRSQNHSYIGHVTIIK